MSTRCACGRRSRRGFPPIRALLLVAGAVACNGAQEGVDARIVIGPYLRDATPNAITVVWETESPTGTAVEFGTGEPLARRVEVAGRCALHSARLTGLDPTKPLLYRVVPADDEPGGPSSATFLVQSVRQPGEPLTFAVVGDTQDQTGAWRQLSERIRAERPSFLVHVGDIVETGPDAWRWRDEFFRPARRLLATTPIWAVLGNHEEDSPLYYRYFGGPAPGWRQTFVFGDAQVFLVDTERDLRPGSEQHAWLDGALSRSTARWRFVALHRPPYTSDRDDYGDTMCGESLPGDPRSSVLIPLLERHDVDAVLFGHIHAYERSHPIRGGRVDPSGVVYLQTGGGGGRLEESADARSWHAAALRRCHHFATITLLGESMEIRAYDEEGRLFDVSTHPSHVRGRPSAVAQSLAGAH